MKQFILTFAILLLMSANINAQWETLNEGFEGRIKTIDFVTEDIGWIAGERGILLKTEDGGENWNTIPMNEDWRIHMIDFINESVGWAIRIINLNIYAILKTVDGGYNWSIQKQLDTELESRYVVD